MSKIIVPLHFQEQFAPPTSAGPGVKKFYLRNQWFKIYDGTSESDLVLDRPLDNFTPISGTITSADSVLSAIEKLDYAVQNVSSTTIWGSITGTVTNQTDLISYLGSNYYPLSSNPAGYISQEQVVEYPNLASFPSTGNLGIIYIALDTDLAYVWDLGTMNYVLTSMPNTGITGIGKTNRIAKFNSPTNIVWSKISEDPVTGSVKVVDSNRAFLDGNSVLSIQRSQSQVDIVLGNPGYSQPSAIWSDNQLDGFEVKSKGILSLKAGTSYLEGLKVLTTGKLQITQTPDTGTTSDYLLLRDSSGNVKQIVYPTIPSLTGYVPYTGATQNVDLGEYELKAGQMTLDVSPTGTATVGTTRWNNTIGSSETTLKGGSVILKNGVDLVARVVNKVTPNTTLTKANYPAVRVTGAQGQRLAVAYAQANNDNNSADTIGLVCETIATNQEGFIITVGQLEEINTTGSLQGETWADGDVLYLSPTTAGSLTNVKPTGATGHIVVIGYVEYAHAIHGKIYVKVMNGWELDELHNVYIDTPLNNQVLAYTSSTQLWENKSVSTALGYTPLPTTAGTTTGTVLTFVTDRVYGSIATPETGNISVDTTNAEIGVTNVIIHNSGTAPTFTSPFKKLSGSGNYVTSQINYIFCMYINSTEIIYSINQRA